MPELVANCPRCKARHISFNIQSANHFKTEYGWQMWHEAFSVCKHCGRSTIFILSDKVDGDYQYVHRVGLMSINNIALNKFVDVRGHISQKDEATISPPDHIPENIKFAFLEGATCLTVACYNAAATMFRLCIDLSTRSLLPAEPVDGLNHRTRRDLGLRLPWLFENGKLPIDLKDLSICVKEDGNDGAHAGTLTEADAEDMLDFTCALLERIYTEPERLKLAKERRDARRAK